MVLKALPHMNSVSFFFEVGLNIRLLAGQLVIQFCHFRVDVILAFEHSEKLVRTVD